MEGCPLVFREIAKDMDFTTPANFSTRSKRQRLNSVDTSYQLGWTGIARGGNWLHELRASYFPRDYTLDNPDFGGPPLAPEGELRAKLTPTVSITNTATFGGGAVTLAMHTVIPANNTARPAVDAASETASWVDNPRRIPARVRVRMNRE